MKHQFDIFNSNSENTLRFALGNKGNSPLLILGLNPSTADKNTSDATMTRVKEYVKRNEYDGFFMLNLYPQRATYPNDLDFELNDSFHGQNLEAIKDLLIAHKPTAVLAAWGENIKVREYLKQCLIDILAILEEQKLNWFRIGSLLQSGHPRHPSRGEYFDFESFDVHKYLDNMLSSFKTINDEGFKVEKEDEEFNYHELLTPRLDKLEGDFDQSTINQIVLWKVNRYANVDKETLDLLNELNGKLDKPKARKVLKKLLGSKGIQLPMASTILRFKNPTVFQIIDQRVFRIIYGSTLSLPAYQSDKNIEKQIDLYFEYLEKLRVVSTDLDIKFEEADRILYNADKRVNKNKKLKNY